MEETRGFRNPQRTRATRDDVTCDGNLANPSPKPTDDSRDFPERVRVEAPEVDFFLEDTEKNLETSDG